jgi:uncharacterized protein
MPASENTETIKAIYEAFGRGDAPAILERVTDDVDWATDATEPAAPWYGERKGKERVGGFFEGVDGAVEVLEFEPRAFAANDDEVMTFVHFRARARETGREIDMHLHHYFRFRDGKIEYYRGSEDTAQTAAALSG